MTVIVEFTIPGPPVALQRARHRVVNIAGASSFTHTYDTAANKQAKHDIAMRAKLVMCRAGHMRPLCDAMGIEINCYRKRPKRNRDEHPISKPDVDNYLKLVLDALNGVVYTDDSRVCSVHAHKRFDENQRTDVRIWTIETKEGAA